MSRADISNPENFWLEIQDGGGDGMQTRRRYLQKDIRPTHISSHRGLNLRPIYLTISSILKKSLCRGLEVKENLVFHEK